MKTGMQHLRRKDFAAAIAEFDAAIAEFDADNARFEQAAGFKTVSLNGHNLAKAHFHRGFARLSSGDLPGAIADFDRVIDIALLWPIPEAYLNRGVARRLAGDLRGAVHDFQSALSVAPKKWRYRTKVERMITEIGENRTAAGSEPGS